MTSTEEPVSRLNLLLSSLAGILVPGGAMISGGYLLAGSMMLVGEELSLRWLTSFTSAFVELAGILVLSVVIRVLLRSHERRLPTALQVLAVSVLPGLIGGWAIGLLGLPAGVGQFANRTWWRGFVFAGVQIVLREVLFLHSGGEWVIINWVIPGLSVVEAVYVALGETVSAD